MQQYMITVIGSAVLAAIAHMVAPEKWVKYIKLVTGIMIISVIAAPFAELKNIDIFSDYEYSDTLDENALKKEVKSETEKRISDDISQRIKQEFNVDAKAEAILCVNERFEIEGVEEIKIWTSKNKEKIRQRITEVYSPKKIIFQD